jgi:cold shock CspA family protein/ribosome-associated translation inhibitor RaiA
MKPSFIKTVVNAPRLGDRKWHVSCPIGRREKYEIRSQGKSPMKIPLQITFRNMPPSESIEKNILQKAAKLELFCKPITSCRVTVEAPHRHHHKGKSYQVRIDLTAPGTEIVINRASKRLKATELRLSEPPERKLAESHATSKQGAHEDVYVVIRDAFNAAGRRLQDYVRRQSGAVKVHEPAAHARVSKLFPLEGYGFLNTPDGREIYFHGNSVLEPGFDHLDIGAEVHFIEEQGEKGPQASTVRFAGKQGSAR